MDLVTYALSEHAEMYDGVSCTFLLRPRFGSAFEEFFLRASANKGSPNWATRAPKYFSAVEEIAAVS
jgi:hypothetical protein